MSLQELLTPGGGHERTGPADAGDVQGTHKKTSWGEDIELKSNFSMQEIKGDEEKEIYLVLLVHGIGSDLDT